MRVVYLFSSLPLLGLFSGRLHQVHKLGIILNVLSIFLHSFSSLFFLTIYPNPPCQVFSCGRKPENPEKTHDFRQSVDELFTRAIRGSIQARTHDLSGGRTSFRRQSHRSPTFIARLILDLRIFKVLPSHPTSEAYLVHRLS